jgi:hypothetical protein
MPGEQAIQQATARVDQVLGDLAQAIMAEFQRIAATLDTTDGVTQNTRFNIQQLESVRAQVSDLATRVGAEQIAEILAEELPQIITQNLTESGLGEFAPQITDDLLDFLDGMERDVVQALNDVSGDLSRAVRRGIAGLAPTAELMESVARSLDTSLGRAAVAVEGSIRRFNEQTLVETAKDLGFGFLYVGPDDFKTRPYCKPRVGKVLTQQQALQLKNDINERWNCRHDIAPVSLDQMQALGLEFYKG